MNLCTTVSMQLIKALVKVKMTLVNEPATMRVINRMSLVEMANGRMTAVKALLNLQATNVGAPFQTPVGREPLLLQVLAGLVHAQDVVVLAR